MESGIEGRVATDLEKHHYEHTASVEGYGVECEGDSISYVPTVQFEYPDDGEHEKPIVRDQWVKAPLLEKCQQRFATVPSGEAMTMPLLDKRLEVLRYALRQAVEQMNLDTIGRLVIKAKATEQRIAVEKQAAETPGMRELHEDIVIHDDAERGKVVIHFPAAIDQRTRRWVKMCGFNGSGDGATFWRKRTFRRGDNIGLDTARHCVSRIVEDRGKLAAVAKPPVQVAMDNFESPSRIHPLAA